MKLNEPFSAIKSLNEGKLHTPVEVKGVATYRAMLQELELLRQNMIRAQDAEAEREEKHRTSVASVAHDLKTPLTVIAGYAECLEDGLKDKNYVALILAKCAEMNELILTLLTAAKEERESQTQERQKISARAFFQAEIKRHATLIQKKGLTLRVTKIPDVLLRISYAQIARVVQNVISNAVKYTETGEICISFCRKGCFLAVKISDTGKGIAKENLELVFDKFFMEDASRGNAKNSGLGLYIAKQTVVAHGGKISAENKRRGGSVFTFTLPLDAETKARKRYMSSEFDRMPYLLRLLLVVVLWPIVGFVYRFSKYHKNQNFSTLVGAVILMPLFVFTWILDIVSVAVCGKITLLAD